MDSSMILDNLGSYNICLTGLLHIYDRNTLISIITSSVLQSLPMIPISDFIQSFQQRKFTITHALTPPVVAFCPCQLCNVRPQLAQLQVFPKPSSDIKIVLRNICNPKHRQISGAVGVRVSQTCFYQKGEPTSILGNRRGLAIKQIRKNINNTLINKVLNENRRLYRERLKLKHNSRDAVLIHFVDQYPQIFTEIQFLNMLNKRKSDPFWSSVDKISNFTWSPSIESNRHFFYYFQGKDKGSLFQAAKNYIQSICGHYNASYNNFVSNQQQAKFVKTMNRKDRLQYASYKIINFMEIIHQTDVRRLVLDLSINEIDQVVLIDAFHFEGTQYPPLEWNEEIYKRRLQNQANQILEIREEHRGVSLKEEKLRKLEVEMYQHFHSLKFKYGLIEQQPKSEFAQSDRVFRKLRPKAPPLSLLIREGITLQSFKKTFYPCRTKPQFNMMTTVLHRLTSHSRQRKSEKKQRRVGWKGSEEQRTGVKRLSISVRL